MRGNDSSREGLGPGGDDAAAATPEVAIGPVRDERDEPVPSLAERMNDPARVLALTDGVIAIIITLLVLEVHVPELTQGQSLAAALEELRPTLTSFVISFIVAGMYWVAHRDIFALIRRTDRGLVWLNLLFLLPLSLLPFGASLLGRYEQEPVALRIYGLVLVAIAIMRVLIWVYATRRSDLLWVPMTDHARNAGLALNALPGLAYLIALLVAFVAPGVSLLIYGGIPLLYFLGITILRRDRKGNVEYADFT
jgi:uncharacterized membrane protein